MSDAGPFSFSPMSILILLIGLLCMVVLVGVVVSLFSETKPTPPRTEPGAGQNTELAGKIKDNPLTKEGLDGK